MLLHDFNLASPYLQALSSREAIVAFIAQLCYNTGVRLRRTSAALRFSDLNENGDLQVYLLEMKQVAVARRRTLARIMSWLRTEYERSVETLKPLKAQLAWTDGVIDQIVYRLYGLTAEEIRVVEERR